MKKQYAVTLEFMGKYHTLVEATSKDEAANEAIMELQIALESGDLEADVTDCTARPT